jgi:Uri superfamily endonuclease
MKRTIFPQSPIYSKITISGDPLPCGVYLVAIQLSDDYQLAFGEFQHGKKINLPQGTYLYVGSAFGQHRSSSLGYRLLRHASRSGSAIPHLIRPELQRSLDAVGLLGSIPKRKTPHWHIDYLIDLPTAEIHGIAVLRTNRQVESELGDRLAQQPETLILAQGLGASDYPGKTHLFFVDADAKWWSKLPDNLKFS